MAKQPWKTLDFLISEGVRTLINYLIFDDHISYRIMVFYIPSAEYELLSKLVKHKLREVSVVLNLSKFWVIIIQLSYVPLRAYN